MKQTLISLARLSKTILAHQQYALRGDLGYEELKAPPGERVLICAPHPDDDVIGCGGAIALLRQRGKQVDIVYRYDVAPKRWEEACAGAAILGVSVERLHWAKTDTELCQIIQELKPDTIYLPSGIDNHKDHVALHRTVIGNATADITLVNYEVWTPVFFNKVLSIDEVIQQKQAAIRAHKSQLKDRDYEAALTGLAQYRGASLGVGAYAECYLVVPVPVAKKLAVYAVAS